MAYFDYPEVECVFCDVNTRDEFMEFKGKIVCNYCLIEFNKLFEQNRWGTEKSKISGTYKIQEFWGEKTKWQNLR